MSYNPPFTITSTIVNSISSIAEALGRMSVLREKDLKLRRINKIKTIQGSLAIEGNTLSEEQVRTILEGKTVLAPIREIQEVRNAIKVYDRYEQWLPGSQEDLLEAHKVLMEGLIDQPGQYRLKSAGVMGKEKIIHVAPPAANVPALMKDLLKWTESSHEHPLIVSSVFHYEFEFIHPFEDGNGRIGRLWQSLILTRWNRLFKDIPIENMVFQRQQEYYQAINQSSSAGESTPFLEFMLDTIQKEIQVTTQEKPRKTTQEMILGLLKQKPASTRRELADRLSLTPDGIKYHLDKMRKAGIIRHSGPTKKGHWEILNDE